MGGTTDVGMIGVRLMIIIEAELGIRVAPLVGLHHIFKKGGYRHGAYTSGDGCDEGGNLGRLFKIHITNQAGAPLGFRCIHLVDSNINHDGSRFQPLPLDHLWLATSGNDHIGTSKVRRKVLGP